MASTVESLKMAFDMLNDGLQSFGRSRAIDNARTQIADIDKRGDVDNVKKIELKNNAVNELQTRLASLGMDAGRINVIAKSMAPKELPDISKMNSIQQIAIAGATTKDPNVAKSAKLAIDAWASLEDRKLAIQKNAEIKKIKELQRLGITAQGKPVNAEKKLAKLSDSAIRDVKDLSTELSRAEGVRAMARQDRFKDCFGTSAEGEEKWLKVPYLGKTIASKDYQLIKADVGQWFDTYRKAITGAGAGKAEIDILTENRPNMTDPYDLFMQKVDRCIAAGKVARARNLLIENKAGRDVSGFNSEIQAGIEAAKFLGIDLETNENDVNNYNNRMAQKSEQKAPKRASLLKME